MRKKILKHKITDSEYWYKYLSNVIYTDIFKGLPKDDCISYIAVRHQRIGIFFEGDGLDRLEKAYGVDKFKEKRAAWWDKVISHISYSKFVLAGLSGDDKVLFNKDLKSFGSLIAVGGSPNTFSAKVKVANALLGNYISQETWPSRKELSECLADLKIDIKKSALQKALDELGLRDLIRDTQNG